MHKRKVIITNNLKALRLSMGYTQKQVCLYLEVSSEVSLSHWEQGTNVPGLENLIKLCLLYKITVFDLYPELVQTTEKHYEEMNMSLETRDMS